MIALLSVVLMVLVSVVLLVLVLGLVSVLVVLHHCVSMRSVVAFVFF